MLAAATTGWFKSALFSNNNSISCFFLLAEYIMVGRAARGNPYIFTQINDYLKKGSYKELSDVEKLQKFHEYLKLAKKYNIPFIKVKGHAMQFTKGTTMAKRLREELIKIKDYDMLIEAMK